MKIKLFEKNKNELSSTAEKTNVYKPLIKYSKRRNEILSNKEASIINKENKKFFKVLSIALIVAVSIILIGAIIDIFEFFYNINKYAGYISIAILLLLLIIFVIRPIVIAFSTPCFTLDIIDNKNKKDISKINFKKLQKVANNLVEGDNISDKSKEIIKKNIDNKKELNNILREIYVKEINVKISKIINESSTKVLISTAISQNNKFDALTVAILNVRLIMRIVIACGYHPTYPQLYKLIVKVFRNALIAYTIQSMNVDEVIFNGINKLVKGALSQIPILGEVTKSLTQGAANALLTLRVGIITRKYLYEEFDIQAMMSDEESTNEKILVEAIEEADSEIDNIIKECKNQKQD